MMHNVYLLFHILTDVVEMRPISLYHLAASRADKLWRIPFSSGMKHFSNEIGPQIGFQFTLLYKQTHKFSPEF